MAEASPETPEGTPEPPLSLEERLKRLDPLDYQGQAEAIQKDIGRKYRERKAAGKIPDFVVPAPKKPDATQQQAQRAVETSTPETETANATREAAHKLRSQQQGYLQRVASRRGVAADAALLDSLVEAASRPVTPEYGYDPSLAFYDPDAPGIDTDAAEAVNIWSMSTLGKKYKSPQELREKLPEDRRIFEEDFAKVVREYQTTSKGGETITALIGDEITDPIERAPSQDINEQVARKLPPSAFQTALQANFGPELKEVLRTTSNTEYDRDVVVEALGESAGERFLQDALRAREKGYIGDFFVRMFDSPTGPSINAQRIYDRASLYRYTALRTQLGRAPTTEEREAMNRQANSFAERLIAKMRDVDAPIYYPDPTGAFKDYLEGKSLLGKFSNFAQVMASVATFGLDEVFGDIPDKTIQANLALLLPRLDVAGVVIDKDGEKKRVGEAGVAGYYLGENTLTNTVDFLLRLTPFSEATGAAYGIAVDKVLRKHGTIDGHAKEVAQEIANVWGSEDHIFRIASRDDDLGTLMASIGRVVDPSVLAGVREESGGGMAIAGLIGMFALLVWEPDAFASFGPALRGAKTIAREGALQAGLDSSAMIARRMSKEQPWSKPFQYEGKTGVEALEAADRALDAAPDDAAAQAILDQLYTAPTSDATGVLGQMWRLAEMWGLKKMSVRAAGRVDSTAVKETVKAMRAQVGKYDEDVSRLDKIVDDLAEEYESPQKLRADVAEYRTHGETFTRATQEAAAARTDAALLQEQIRALEALFGRMGKGKVGRKFARDLSDPAIRKILEDAGLDPDTTLSIARGINKNRKAGDDASDLLEPQFIEALQTALRRSLAEGSEGLAAATRAKFGTEAQRLLRRADAAEEAARKARDAQGEIRNSFEAVFKDHSPEVSELFDKVEDAAKAFEQRLVEQSHAKIRAEGASQKVRDFRKLFISNLIRIARTAEAFGQVSATGRGRIAEALERLRTRIEPEKARLEVEAVAAAEPKLGRVLEDLRARFPDEDDYIKNMMLLLQEQKYLREAILHPLTVSHQIRHLPQRSAGALHRALFTVEATVLRLAMDGRKFLRYFNLEQGVTDLQMSDELRRAAEKGIILGRAADSDYNMLIKYAGTEDIEKLKEISEDFILNPRKQTITTAVGQEITLSSQVGRSESIADDALQELYDRARLRPWVGDTEEADSSIVVLVKALGPDLVKSEDADKLKGVVDKVYEGLGKMSEKELKGRPGLERLETIIKEAHLEQGFSPVSKWSGKSYGLYYRTLNLLATERTVVKRAADIYGTRFTPKIARSLNFLMSEGREGASELFEGIEIGDMVVGLEASQKFNRLINIKTRGADIRSKKGDLEATVRGKAGRQLELHREVRSGMDEAYNRDVYLEELLKDTDVGLPAYKVLDKFKEGDEAMLRVRSASGEVTTLPEAQLVLRDPRVSMLDTFDALFELGLPPSIGRAKEVVLLGSKIRREYHGLIAKSMDADGNYRIIPRDMLKRTYDALEGLEKEVTQALSDKAMGSMIFQKAWGTFRGFLRLFKRTILFGVVVPRPAFLTNAVFGDTTQMMLDINHQTGLRVGLLGSLGYIPFVGKQIQAKAAQVAYRSTPLPTAMGSWFNKNVDAILEGTSAKLYYADGTVMKAEDGTTDLTGAMLHREAVARGAYDNILTPDALRQLREAQQGPYIKAESVWRKVADKADAWTHLTELQMREATLRQRMLLFMDARMNRRLSADEAGDEMRKALYNWDTAVGDAEIAIMGELVLFYTFMKNAMAQVHRTILEGANEPLDVYLKKFARGNTKMQRLELMTRLTQIPQYSSTQPQKELTPQEAYDFANQQRLSEYLAEYTMLDYGTLSEKQEDLMLKMGVPRSNYAHVLPKITPVEFLQTYVNVVNYTLVPAAVGALNFITGGSPTGYEVHNKAAAKKFIELLSDFTGPVGHALLRGGLGALGYSSEYAVSEYGPRVRVDEAVMLQFLGYGDTLVPDPRDGSLRIAGNPEGEGMLQVMSTSAMRTFLLPGYIRFRTLDELALGGALSDSVAEIVGLVLELPPARVEALKLGPAQVELTRVEQGELAARLTALEKLVGFGTTHYYSGEQDMDWDVKNAKALGDFSMNSQKRRFESINKE